MCIFILLLRRSRLMGEDGVSMGHGMSEIFS